MNNAEPSITFKLDIITVYNTLNILSESNIRNFRKNFSGLDVVEMDKNFSSIPTVGATIEVMHYIFGQI
ncbi:MAG TPA: hypothetical protein LFW11_03295 [Rickettsia endosymbiont of Proechinophthirus fluctus]|uniref:hypothetical protein n=1 Tax=Rickettsia endosymbiont of Proechinophthirus fluctus TaxID=1462733 RepID=UPI000A661354|nr:hypothetical protein [Rickettsia endosymbiont of Proechinophthirus fluctus]HJD54375.1 hypothetical protein [Rickettsia endosymbiont of Proechinophthirus fluctus]